MIIKDINNDGTIKKEYAEDAPGHDGSSNHNTAEYTAGAVPCKYCESETAYTY